MSSIEDKRDIYIENLEDHINDGMEADFLINGLFTLSVTGDLIEEDEINLPMILTIDINSNLTNSEVLTELVNKAQELVDTYDTSSKKIRIRINPPQL